MTSRVFPRPAPQIAAVSATTPFVAPEELARRAGVRDLLRLGANESAFGPSPRAIAAMRDAAPMVSWYGDPESTELREALGARHRCGAGNIVVAGGIDELLGLAVRAYCAPGESAAVTRGTYATFFYHLNAGGVLPAYAEPTAIGGFDVEALVDAQRRSGAKLVYVANPDNPSGSFSAAPALVALRERLPDDVLLLVDEAYADFVDSAELLPDEIDPRIIRTRTFSKAYGLAGARVGYAIASEDAVATFQKLRNHFAVGRISQAGALAALGDEAFLRGVIAEIALGRRDYAELAARHGLRSLPSSTNFVCIEIGTREHAEAMVEMLLRLGVFVRKPWAPPIDGYIRVTVGTPHERARFAERFAEALARVRDAVVT